MVNNKRAFVALTLAVSALLPAAAQASSDFAYERAFLLPGRYQGLTDDYTSVELDADGRLYVTNNESDPRAVEVYSSFESGNDHIRTVIGSGDTVRKCGTQAGQGETEVTKLLKPVSIAIDPGSQKPYVLDLATGRVHIYASADDGFGPFGTFCASEVSRLGGAQDIFSLAFYKEDKLFLGIMQRQDDFGHIAAIDTVSQDLVGFFTQALMAPINLHVDRARGHVYVVDAMMKRVDVYQLIERSGLESVRLKPLEGTPLGSYGSGVVPLGVATDSLGRVYVAESYQIMPHGGGRVSVYSSYEDGFKKLRTIEGVNMPRGFVEFNAPSDIAVDGARVYIADRAEKDIIWRLRFDDADGDGEFDRDAEQQAGSSAVPQPEATPAQVQADTTGPSSRIKGIRRKKMRCKRISKARRCRPRRVASKVYGLASDDSSGVAVVRVAIWKRVKARTRKGRKGAKKCAYLIMGSLMKRPCDRPLWMRAKLKPIKGDARNIRWTLPFSGLQKKLLRGGSWQIRSAAEDRVGNRESTVRRKANLLRAKL